jgi:hypothetical protein
MTKDRRRNNGGYRKPTPTAKNAVSGPRCIIVKEQTAILLHLQLHPGGDYGE